MNLVRISKFLDNHRTKFMPKHVLFVETGGKELQKSPRKGIVTNAKRLWQTKQKYIYKTCFAQGRIVTWLNW